MDINKLLRASPVNGKYGAPMGRYDRTDGGTDRLHLQRVRFIDGDYSADGTYWGGGMGTQPLYAAFTPDLETLCFTRARHWAEAEGIFHARGFTFKAIRRDNPARSLES